MVDVEEQLSIGVRLYKLQPMGDGVDATEGKEIVWMERFETQDHTLCFRQQRHFSQAGFDVFIRFGRRLRWVADTTGDYGEGLGAQFRCDVDHLIVSEIILGLWPRAGEISHAADGRYAQPVVPQALSQRRHSHFEKRCTGNADLLDAGGADHLGEVGKRNIVAADIVVDR